MRTSAVALSLPFDGRWLVQNSPARRVPSHGPGAIETETQEAALRELETAHPWAT